MIRQPTNTLMFPFQALSVLPFAQNHHKKVKKQEFLGPTHKNAAKIEIFRENKNNQGVSGISGPKECPSFNVCDWLIVNKLMNQQNCMEKNYDTFQTLSFINSSVATHLLTNIFASADACSLVVLSRTSSRPINKPIPLWWINGGHKWVKRRREVHL